MRVVLSLAATNKINRERLVAGEYCAYEQGSLKKSVDKRPVQYYGL